MRVIVSESFSWAVDGTVTVIGRYAVRPFSTGPIPERTVLGQFPPVSVTVYVSDILPMLLTGTQYLTS